MYCSSDSSNINDLGQLHTIWNTVFDIKDAELFFSNLYNPELTIVADLDSTIIAMGFLLPVGDLVTGNNNDIPCAMIYGVATLPEYRGIGCGGAVSNELIKLANTNGYPAVVLCPANDGLFDFYSKKTSMLEWFYINEYILTFPFKESDYIKSEEITTEEYLLLRESLLKNIPHIMYDQQVFDYQMKICDVYGGGILRFDLKPGNACAVVERQTNKLIIIKELLLPIDLNLQNHSDIITDITYDIFKKFPAKRYIIRTPGLRYNVNNTDENVTNLNKRFATLSLSVNTKVTENTNFALPWYGMAFD